MAEACRLVQSSPFSEMRCAEVRRPSAVWSVQLGFRSLGLQSEARREEEIRRPEPLVRVCYTFTCAEPSRWSAFTAC